MRRALFILLLPGLVACGGGSIQVNNRPESYRSASRTIQDLQNASSEEETRRLLTLLKEKGGDNLDWSEFWRLLGDSPAGQKLSADYAELLFPLHARNCSALAYAAFVTFVTRQNRGWDFIFGKHATCQAALPAETATSAFRTYLRGRRIRIAEMPQEDLTTLFSFLTTQLRLQPTVSWGKALTAADLGDIATGIRTLPADNLSGLELALQFQAVTAQPLLMDFISEQIFRRTSYATHLIEKRGVAETLRVLVQFLQQRGSRNSRYSEFETRDIYRILLDRGFAEAQGNIEFAWASYLLFRQFHLLVSSRWKPHEQLTKFHLIQTCFENWMRASPASDVRQFFLENFKDRIPQTDGLDLAWFALRLSVEKDSIWNQAQAHFQKISTIFSQRIDRILSGRLAVHFAEQMSERRAATDSFCAVLRNEGFAGQKLENLKASLISGVGPGCFEVTPPSEGQVKTDVPLGTSPDTVLRISAPNLRLQAPAFELGIVDLSVVERVFEKALPFNQAAHLVLPFLVGVPFEESESEFEAGTHYFIVHQPVLGTANAESLEENRYRGKQGGILTLASSKPPFPFGFVSAGGRGGIALEADLSEVEVQRVRSFLLQLEGAPSHTVFHASLSLAQLRRLVYRLQELPESKILVPLEWQGESTDYQQKKLDFYCALKPEHCSHSSLVQKLRHSLEEAAINEFLLQTDAWKSFVWPGNQKNSFDVMGPWGIAGQVVFSKEMDP